MGIAAFFAAPFGYLVIRNGSNLSGFLETATELQGLGPLARSLLLAVCVAMSSTVIGTAAAWAVTRTDLPGRALWRIVLPLPLVIPSFIGAFVLLAAFAPGGLLEALLAPLGVDRLRPFYGFAGSFVVLTLFTYPYVYLPTTARLRQLPSSLEESARLLGNSPLKTFVRIVLPQARAAIFAGTLLVFLYTISDFGVVQLMRYDTLTRVIYATRLFDRPTSLALSLQLGGIALLVVMVERVLVRSRLRIDARRSKGGFTAALGAWRWPGAALIAGLVSLALVVPVGVLVWWSLRGLMRGSTSGTELLSSLSDLATPTLNTSVASVSAAFVAVVLVTPVAYLFVRHRSPIGGAANAFIVGGFALPGLVIALSLVFWTLGTPAIGVLYQTLPLLVLAYVIHFGSQALRTAQVAVASVPVNVEDAARSLGANRWRRFASVELPLMLPGLLSGAGIVLLSTMKELPASLILAPAGFQTLAIKIWSATESAVFADASLASLLLIALSGLLTWLLIIRRTDPLA